MFEIHELALVERKLHTKKIVKFNTKRYSTGAIDIVGGDENALVLDVEDFNILDVDVGDAVAPTSTIKTDINKLSIINPVVDIYEEDNVLDLRRKITIIFDIPIYKQHCFYRIGSRGSVVPLSYVLHNIADIPVDIEKALDGTSWINDAPVNNNLYSMREMLRVQSFEEFRVIRQIIPLTDKIYVINIDEFFDRAAVEALDVYSKELLYYGFVLPYFPMMSIDVFHAYVKNGENEIASSYTQLVDPRLDIYMEEKKLKKDMPADVAASIKKLHLNQAITSAKVVVENDININLLNLFDALTCDDVITYVKAKLYVQGMPVELLKYYDPTSIRGHDTPREQYDMNSLLINKVITLREGDSYDVINSTFVISRDGTYYVKIAIREDFGITFDKLIALVSREFNGLISQINGLGFKIGLPLPLISEKISSIQDISIAIFWKKPESISALNSILVRMVRSGILVRNTHEEYFIRKGIYRFNALLIDEVANPVSYYERFYNSQMATKWENLFFKNRKMIVSLRHNDIKIHIINLHREEKDLIYSLMLGAVFLADSVKIAPTLAASTSDAMSNRKLRKLKEMDPVLYDFPSNGDVLSKKCQKPLQPLILTDAEYDALSAADKERVEEYYNFTNHGKSKYMCNANYPYLQFIVGVHPQRYCVPCCKKTKPKETSVKYESYMKCRESGNAMIENKSTTVSSTEAPTDRSRYVASFGKDILPGKLCHLPDDLLPLFNPISNITDIECKTDEGAFILGVPQTISNSNISNRGLLHGLAVLLDTTYTALVDASLAKCDELYRAKWNDTVNDLVPIVTAVKKIWNIGVIILRYEGDHTSLSYMSSVSSGESFIPFENVAILIEKASADFQKHVYPIIWTSRIDFFNESKIERTLFNKSSHSIKYLMALIDEDIEDGLDEYNNMWDLKVITDFTDATSWEITGYYMTGEECYAIDLMKKKVGPIYVPINLSYMDAKHKGAPTISKVEDLMIFVKEYNAISKSYTIVWDSVVEYMGKVVGLNSSNGMLWYCNKGLPKLPINSITYDISWLNAQSITYDMSEFNGALYSSYAYHLMTMTFVYYMYMKRNARARTKLIADIVRNPTSVLRTAHEEDVHKLLPIVRKYRDTGAKEQMIKAISDIQFTFDLEEFNKLVALPHDKLVNELISLMKKLTTRGKFKGEFPNVLIPCLNSKASYCTGNKIIIEDALPEFCEHLANDIHNDFKRRYMLNIRLYNTIINPLDFTHRANNIIIVA